MADREQPIESLRNTEVGWGEDPKASEYRTQETTPELTEEQEAERDARLKLAAEKQREEMRVLLNTYGGRATIWRILSYAGTFRGPVSDPIDGWRQVGMADVGRTLLTWVDEADIKAIGNMYAEANQRDKELNYAG